MFPAKSKFVTFLSALELASHAVGTAPPEKFEPPSKNHSIVKLFALSSSKAPVVSAAKFITLCSQVSAEDIEYVPPICLVLSTSLKLTCKLLPVLLAFTQNA